jgi:hypothetical protein
MKDWVLLRVTIPRRTCRTSSLTAELQVEISTKLYQFFYIINL